MAVPGYCARGILLFWYRMCANDDVQAERFDRSARERRVREAARARDRPDADGGRIKLRWRHRGLTRHMGKGGFTDIVDRHFVPEFFECQSHLALNRSSGNTRDLLRYIFHREISLLFSFFVCFAFTSLHGNGVISGSSSDE